MTQHYPTPQPKLLSILRLTGLSLSFVIVILLSFYVISISQDSPDRKLLLNALSYDLSIIFPLVYLIFIWSGRIPKLSVIPVFFVMTIIAGYLIPKDSQTHLNHISGWVLLLVELVLISFVILKSVKARRSYRQLKSADNDFYTNINTILKDSFPAFLVKILSLEFSVIYYSFFRWRRPPHRESHFSQATSGAISVLWVALFLILIETVVIHILLHKWAPTAAWIATALSLYGLIQILAIIKSFYLRPSRLSSDVLFLKCGLLRQVTINLSSILSVTKASWNSKKEDHFYFSPLKDFETPNILLELSEDHSVGSVYSTYPGIRKLAFYLDDPDKLIASIKKAQHERAGSVPS
ncbi:MAG: hypothetical protein OEZ36_05085 [Spirochaetota bacterium]|nr:hypothetical protein [Spirochaetota bacterium]